MSEEKITWTEGMFLRAHLFQQQERYFEEFVHKHVLSLNPYFWGFSEINLDTRALHSGILSLPSAVGVFKDGTPFGIPKSAYEVPSLQITETDVDEIIVLALAAHQPTGTETVFEHEWKAQTRTGAIRYIASEKELFDTTSANRGTFSSQVSKLNFILAPSKKLGDGTNWLKLPVAKVADVSPSKQVTLDPNFVPPMLNIRANEWLYQWLGRIAGLTQTRAKNIASRLTSSSDFQRQAADVADYMILMLLNKYNPLLFHHYHSTFASPKEIYEILIAYLGELSTFVLPETRLLFTDIEKPFTKTTVMPYSHEDPYTTFELLFSQLHRSLNEIIIKSADRLVLEDKRGGLMICNVPNNELNEFRSLILLVKSDIGSEKLMAEFPSHTKVASSHLIAELTKLHLGGLKLQYLPVPPRQVPYLSGCVYYEISREGKVWDEMVQTGSVALHVAGDFPGLHVELWGIRS